MKRTLLLLPIFLALYSCSQDSDKIENVNLNFNNGEMYCVGKYKILSGGLFSKDKKIYIENWNLFHPNGQLHMTLNYDENGELIGGKEFSEKGNILKSYSLKDNKTIISWYHINGKVRTKEIYEDNEEDEDGENTYSIINEKDYYENGALKSQTQNNELIIWDSAGTELIRLKYDDNGIIITDKSELK